MVPHCKGYVVFQAEVSRHHGIQVAGEVAVGLVEGTVEDPELSEEESEEEETSLKRDTSRLNANTGLKSRKVSGMSQLSSSLRSPSSPR